MMHACFVLGDFNCPLQSSACTSYLAFGAVTPGVLEWGREAHADTLKVPAHDLKMASAYQEARHDDFTFTISGSRGHFLDHLWYDTRNIQLVDTQALFPNGLRDQILKVGLPCPDNPSDHISIGASFSWSEGTLQPLMSGPPTHTKSGPNVEADIVEVQELLDNCPWDSETQRAEFEEATSGIELKKGEKPTQEQLASLENARLRKGKLLAGASADVSLILGRILELRKRIKKHTKTKKATPPPK